MLLSKKKKDTLKKDLVKYLAPESEVRKIIVFGSFLTSKNPNDLDVAIFQDSNDQYLSLSLKYRKKTRPISHFIPLDIFPIKMSSKGECFFSEIEAGEVIYEK